MFKSYQRCIELSRHPGGFAMSWKLFGKFILSKHWLITYYVLITVLEAENRKLNTMVIAIKEFIILWRRQIYTIHTTYFFSVPCVVLYNYDLPTSTLHLCVPACLDSWLSDVWFSSNDPLLWEYLAVVCELLDCLLCKTCLPLLVCTKRWNESISPHFHGGFGVKLSLLPKRAKVSVSN